MKGLSVTAEDVVQDTFIRYYTLKKEFDSGQHIRAWLIRVTINRAKNVTHTFWRRNKLSMWIHGSKTEVEATGNGSGGYTFTYEADGEIKEMGGGGVSIGEDGSYPYSQREEPEDDRSLYTNVLTE